MLSETLSLAPEPGAPALARRRLRRLLHDVPPEVVDDVVLLATEVVTNSLRHADVASNDRIHVAVRADRKSVRIAVTDPGRGDVFTPRLPEPEEPGGRGLLLVAEMSDRWGIDRSQATTVWFEVLLRSRVSSRAG